MLFHLYGFFIALGILVATWIVKGWDLLPWILIPGLIGARLYHVIDYWDYYSKNLEEIFYLWQGGLAIFGALAGGVLGLWFLKTIKKLNQKQFLKLLDSAALALPLAQAIGRWGNYFNQELYGWPTDLAWGIYIKPENRLPGFEDFEKFHPLFLYESLGCLIIFIFLFFVLKTKKLGLTFFLYLFLYAFLRFCLEFLRIESWIIGGIRVNQLVSLGLMIISGWFLRGNRGRKT